MSPENPYAPPRSEIAESPAPQTDTRPSIGARFLWTTAWAIPMYLFFVFFFSPSESWLVGSLGSVLLAMGCGLLAMCIPVRRKAGFIIPSLLAGLVFAYILGRVTG